MLLGLTVGSLLLVGGYYWRRGGGAGNGCPSPPSPPLAGVSKAFIMTKIKPGAKTPVTVVDGYRRFEAKVPGSPDVTGTHVDSGSPAVIKRRSGAAGSYFNTYDVVSQGRAHISSDTTDGAYELDVQTLCSPVVVPPPTLPPPIGHRGVGVGAGTPFASLVVRHAAAQ